jgi:hypothetical protein
MLIAAARSGRGNARQKARSGIAVRPLFFAGMAVMTFHAIAHTSRLQAQGWCRAGVSKTAASAPLRSPSRNANCAACVLRLC